MKNLEENFPGGTNSKGNIFEGRKEGLELVRVVVAEGGEVGEAGSPWGPAGHLGELSFYEFAVGSPQRVAAWRVYELILLKPDEKF